MNYHWNTIRDKAAAAFADIPSGRLEQDILDRFAEDPEHVIRTIERIIKTHATKPFGSPWAVIRADLQRTATTDLIVSSTRSKQAAAERATTWIHNAGCHHPTWQECAQELFGDQTTTPDLTYLEALELHTRNNPGRPIYDTLLQAAITHTAEHGPQQVPPDTSAPLYRHRDDTELRDQLKAEWITQRDAALQTEQDHQTWCETAKHNRQILLKKRKARTETETGEAHNATTSGQRRDDQDDKAGLDPGPLEVPVSATATATDINLDT